MKFIDLLLEDEFLDNDLKSQIPTEYYTIKKFENILNTDINKLSVHSIDIIKRGVSTEKSTSISTGFEKYTIRKDRPPTDTLVILDTFLDVYRRIYNPTKPSRHEVLFASCYDDIVDRFGSSIVYIFPSKDCKIWLSSYDDSIDIIQDDIKDIYYSDNDLEEILIYMKEEHSSIYNIIELLFNSIDIYWYDDRVKQIYKDFTDIDDKIIFALNDKYIPLKFKKLVLLVMQNWIDESIYQYFNTLNIVTTQSFKYGEIQIEGNTYYSVNIDWFDKNFVFKGGKWIAKYTLTK